MEVGGERGHVVAVVRQRDAAERGHGARELGLGEEAEEAEHGEAAVVDLDEAAALLLLGGGVLREADRVPARKSKVSLVRSVSHRWRGRFDLCTDLYQRSSGTGCGILNWSPASGELKEGKAPGLPPLV